MVRVAASHGSVGSFFLDIVLIEWNSAIFAM